MSFFRERSCLPLTFLSGIGMFRLVTTLGTVCYFPFDQLQVEYKDGIKDRHQKQRDEGSHSEASDLGARTPGFGKHKIEIIRKCSRRRIREVSRTPFKVATESKGTLTFSARDELI